MSWYRIHARLHKNFCRFHMFSRQIGQFRLSARPWNEKKIERIRILSYLSGFSKQKCTIDGCNPVSHAFGYANDCFLICMTGHTKFTTFLVGGINHNHENLGKNQETSSCWSSLWPKSQWEWESNSSSSWGRLLSPLEMEGHFLPL